MPACLSARTASSAHIAKSICLTLAVDMFADPGDRPFAVFEAGVLKIGTDICYDAGFPESCRVLALEGADLLVLPTNWPAHAECAAEHMMANAGMENVVEHARGKPRGRGTGLQVHRPQFDHEPQLRPARLRESVMEEIIIADIDPAIARNKAAK